MERTGRVLTARSVGAPLHFEHREWGSPSEGQALVRVEACGVCGSDLFLIEGGFGDDKFPVVPGHEASGRVEQVGPGVEEFSVGDQVALYYIENDPDSAYVCSGRPNLGPSVRRMGVDCDGAFADYIIRPADTLIQPSSPIDPASLAVLTDAVATPYHALTAIAGLQAGEQLVVIGVGGVGSNAVQLGAYMGADVVAISRSDAKLELAEDLGASAVVRAEGDVAAKVAQITGDGPDVVLQCVGSAAQDRLAVAMARPGGRVVFVGAALDSFPVRATDLIWRELSLMGSRGFTPAEISAVVDLYIAGAVRTDHLIDSQRPLEEAEQALDDLRHSRVLRSVLLTEDP